MCLMGGYCRLSEKSDGMDDVFRKRPYMFAFQARKLQLNDKTAKHCNAKVAARVFDFERVFEIHKITEISVLLAEII